MGEDVNQNHLLQAIEEAFVAHEPDLQEALLDEVKAFASNVNDWINQKIAAKESVK